MGYEASGLGVYAHSTRAVASSQALFKGSSLEDICAAAGWSSSSTFINFYSLDVSRCFPQSILRYVKALWYIVPIATAITA